MRVAVLGAGSIGFGSAALLCQRGHVPVLWSPSGRGTAGLAGAPLVARGAVEGSFAVEVAGSCAAALAGADCVLIAAPGYAHGAVIGAAAPCLRAGQTVLFSSHMSLAGAYLRRLSPAPVVAWGTTVVTGRKTGGAEVWVTNIRAAVDVAVLPGGRHGGGVGGLPRRVRRPLRAAGRAGGDRAQQPQSAEPSGHRAVQPDADGARARRGSNTPTSPRRSGG